MSEMNKSATSNDLEFKTAVNNIGKYFKYKWSMMKKAGIYYAFVAPYAIIFTVFTIAPVIIAIYFSFTNFNMIETPEWLFIDNYYMLFVDDDLFLTSIKNTMLFSCITGPVGYLLSLLFAWLINELPPKVRSIFTLMFYAPSISGTSYTMFNFIFSADEYGLLNSLLLDMNIKTEAVAWLQSEETIPFCVLVVSLWLSLGTGFLSLIAGLQGVSKDYYEAGAIDGIKNRWQELWYITLPTMKDHLLFAAVMSITGAFGMGAVITSLVGFPSPNYAAHTIVHHLEDYGNLRFEMGYASAIAVLLFLLMVVCNELIQRLLRKVGT